MPDLQTAENVRIQRGDTWQPAVVVNKHQQPRSFIVHTPDGRVNRRNRKHLLKTGEREFPPTHTQDTSTYTDSEQTTPRVMQDCKTTEVAPENDTDAGPVQSQLCCTRSGRQLKIPARYRD